MRARITLRPPTVTVESGRVEELYRLAARRKVAELLAENKRLRHGAPVRDGELARLTERLFVKWLERRYPAPPVKETPGEIEVIG